MPKRKWGDRSDAVWLKDIPSMNRIMPVIMPNRADNEAYVSFDLDFRPLEAYLEKKNQGLTEDKYTFFHVISCAVGKAFVLRPRMNRFIAGNRMYQRTELTGAFVIKKQFSDKATESLLFLPLRSGTSYQALAVRSRAGRLPGISCAPVSAHGSAISGSSSDHRFPRLIVGS